MFTFFKKISCQIGCSLLLFSFLGKTTTASPANKPKLVVGIVIDQMRWDYLHRFEERYRKDGFKRLMREGFNCNQTYINYLPTFTAPGHATIYTGTVPALHGIAANDWIENATGANMYCTQDKSVTPIGGGQAGLQSPANLWATTITDELKLATNFKSKVYGISIKDRGAILPVGHSADGAFWFEQETGNFISSSFYLKQLPQWLQRFNQRNIADSLLALDWHTSFPIESYTQSLPDANAYEGTLAHESSPTFPHRTSLAVGEQRKAIRYTPQGNTITRLLAQELILAEKMGQNSVTDFLAVSFSSTDYMGHLYGPNAIEIEDMYYKLDEELALFLHFLDEHIGEGQYTVFLTADHGGAHNPSFLLDKKIPAGSSSEKELLADIRNVLFPQFDQNVVRAVTNYQIYLDEKLIAEKNYDRNEIIKKIKTHCLTRPEISHVLTMDETFEAVPEPLRTRAINGYNPKRSGQLLVILKPAWFHSTYTTGTTHGSWNPYDAKIPLIWYGWGIQSGSTQRTISMTDIAPTLAALLNIQVPNACIGNVIEEVLR